MFLNPGQKLLTLAAILIFASNSSKAEPITSIASPDGKLAVAFHLDANGAPRYSIQLNGNQVLLESRLGLIRDDADFSKGLQLSSTRIEDPIKDRYEILTAKRRVNTYYANRREFHLQTAAGKKMDVIFQVSNDGVAFRYFFPETDSAIHKLSEEVTSFHFPTDARAWLQPMSVAKTGWSQVNPCYEEFYEKEIPVGTPSPMAGWVYPALFRSGQAWVAITEGSLPRNYCGTRLRAESPNGEYSVGFPDSRESFHNGPVNPESTLPWLTPWRIIAIGSLKTIGESTLGTDVADKPAHAVDMKGKPGKASWSWPLLGDDQTKYDVQKRFIDYAAEMNWRYCLIDALWDKQIGYDKIQELVDYARGKNVSILLWYNSAGNWNVAPQTPRNVMTNHVSRVKEFERLKQMGVAGLKIDFFGGDGQSMIDYYLDIIHDAEPYGFLLNFHGATLPRGWQRTYPHIVTTEAIRGFEYCTFEQANADQEPTHAAMLPFTRNLFDPMDFTPMALDRINDRCKRQTTSAFELALSVLFTSGIQHYAEIPQGMAKVPDYVREFLRHVPSVWDDMKFIDGYPGKFVVIARKGDGHWYVAGINGENSEKKLTLDLSELRMNKPGTLITDRSTENLSFKKETVRLSSDKKVGVTLQPRGGFVLVFD
jgi:alpha-glucosidase